MNVAKLHLDKQTLERQIETHKRSIVTLADYLDSVYVEQTMMESAQRRLDAIITKLEPSK